eukprot:3555360-Pyramimonas_sp.AAC.1
MDGSPRLVFFDGRISSTDRHSRLRQAHRDGAGGAATRPAGGRPAPRGGAGQPGRGGPRQAGRRRPAGGVRRRAVHPAAGRDRHQVLHPHGGGGGRHPGDSAKRATQRADAVHL